MRSIEFFRRADGSSPVQEYLDSLSDKAVEKVLFSLKLIQQMPVVPTRYFKHLTGTALYEVRAQQGTNIYRLLCFFFEGNLVVLTNGFSKKTQKTPKREIELAEQRRNEYIARKGENNG